jgi:hypothetical protein
MSVTAISEPSVISVSDFSVTIDPTTSGDFTFLINYEDVEGTLRSFTAQVVVSLTCTVPVGPVNDMSSIGYQIGPVIRIDNLDYADATC